MQRKNFNDDKQVFDETLKNYIETVKEYKAGISGLATITTQAYPFDEPA